MLLHELRIDRETPRHLAMLVRTIIVYGADCERARFPTSHHVHLPRVNDQLRPAVHTHPFKNRMQVRLVLLAGFRLADQAPPGTRPEPHVTYSCEVPYDADFEDPEDFERQAAAEGDYGPTVRASRRRSNTSSCMSCHNMARIGKPDPVTKKKKSADFSFLLQEAFPAAASKQVADERRQLLTRAFHSLSSARWTLNAWLHTT